MFKKTLTKTSSASELSTLTLILHLYLSKYTQKSLSNHSRKYEQRFIHFANQKRIDKEFYYFQNSNKQERNSMAFL